MVEPGGLVLRRWRTTIRVAAAAVPLVSCVVLSLVRDHVTAASSVLVLVVWVVGAAATGDRCAGVLAAVSGALWFDFFLTQPYLRFTVSDADDVETTVLLVLISLAVSEIALWGHRMQTQAARRAGYLEGVVGAAQSVAAGNLPGSAVIEMVAQNINDVLGGDTTHFVLGPVHDARVCVLEYDGGLVRGGRVSDVDRVGLPTDEYVAVPVHHDGRMSGHFLVTATSHVARPTREQRRVAVLLADQVASTIRGST